MSVKDNDVRLPQWVVWVMTAAAIPWAVWISYTLTQLVERVSDVPELRKTLNNHEARISTLEGRDELRPSRRGFSPAREKEE